MEGEVSSLARSLGISGSLGCYYAGGAFHQCSGDDVSLLSPVSGELLASTGGCSATDVDAAVQAASACFQSGTWSGLSGKERGVWLKKLAIAVEAKKSDLMRLEAINVGRPIFEMEGDLADTVAFLEFNAGMAEKLDARQGIVLDAPEGFEISMRYDAAGVAACILPFNWPLINVVLKLGAALAAGCTVVLKPSEFTPLTTLAFAQICTEVGMPAGVVNVVTGLGATCGAALTQHPQVSKRVWRACRTDCFDQDSPCSTGLCCCQDNVEGAGVVVVGGRRWVHGLVRHRLPDR
jgi:betaine-aldehyde dehydrogenase